MVGIDLWYAPSFPVVYNMVRRGRKTEMSPKRRKAIIGSPSETYDDQTYIDDWFPSVPEINYRPLKRMTDEYINNPYHLITHIFSPKDIVLFLVLFLPILVYACHQNERVWIVGYLTLSFTTYTCQSVLRAIPYGTVMTMDFGLVEGVALIGILLRMIIKLSGEMRIADIGYATIFVVIMVMQMLTALSDYISEQPEDVQKALRDIFDNRSQFSDSFTSQMSMVKVSLSSEFRNLQHSVFSYDMQIRTSALIALSVLLYTTSELAYDWPWFLYVVYYALLSSAVLTAVFLPDLIETLALVFPIFTLTLQVMVMITVSAMSLGQVPLNDDSYALGGNTLGIRYILMFTSLSLLASLYCIFSLFKQVRTLQDSQERRLQKGIAYASQMFSNAIFIKMPSFRTRQIDKGEETVTVADDIFPADRTSGPDSWAGNDSDTIQQELATQNFETRRMIDKEHNEMQRSLTERQKTGISGPVTSILFSVGCSDSSSRIDHILVAVKGHVPAVRDYHSEDAVINPWRVSTLHTYNYCQCKTFLENTKPDLSLQPAIVDHCVIVNPHHGLARSECDEKILSDTSIVYTYKDMRIEIAKDDEDSVPVISFSLLPSLGEADIVSGIFEATSQGLELDYDSQSTTESECSDSSSCSDICDIYPPLVTIVEMSSLDDAKQKHNLYHVIAGNLQHTVESREGEWNVATQRSYDRKLHNEIKRCSKIDLESSLTPSKVQKLLRENPHFVVTETAPFIDEMGSIVMRSIKPIVSQSMSGETYTYRHTQKTDMEVVVYEPESPSKTTYTPSAEAGTTTSYMTVTKEDHHHAINSILGIEQDYARKVLNEQHLSSDGAHRVTAIVSTLLADYEQSDVSTTIHIVEGILLCKSDSKQSHRNIPKDQKEGWIISLRWLNSPKISDALARSWDEKCKSLTQELRPKFKAYGKCGKLSFLKGASRTDICVRIPEMKIEGAKVTFHDSNHEKAILSFTQDANGVIECRAPNDFAGKERLVKFKIFPDSQIKWTGRLRKPTPLSEYKEEIEECLANGNGSTSESSDVIINIHELKSVLKKSKKKIVMREEQYSQVIAILAVGKADDISLPERFDYHDELNSWTSSTFISRSVALKTSIESGWRKKMMRAKVASFMCWMKEQNGPYNELEMENGNEREVRLCKKLMLDIWAHERKGGCIDHYLKNQPGYDKDHSALVNKCVGMTSEEIYEMSAFQEFFRRYFSMNLLPQSFKHSTVQISNTLIPWPDRLGVEGNPHGCGEGLLVYDYDDRAHIQFSPPGQEAEEICIQRIAQEIEDAAGEQYEHVNNNTTTTYANNNSYDSNLSKSTSGGDEEGAVGGCLSDSFGRHH